MLQNVHFLRIYIPVQDKNPGDNGGTTPLHLAAAEGHFQVCQAILNEVTDKNPSDDDDWTPFHAAAKYGRTDVCQAIMGQIQGKYTLIIFSLRNGIFHESMAQDKIHSMPKTFKIQKLED